MDPEEILKTAARLGFIADQRLKECRDLMERESIPADEALTRVSRLTRDQLRGVLVLSRYDRARHQDVALAEFIVRNGFLPRSIVETCLSEQEIPYQQGESIPRLQDMLLERNHLNGQQLQMILRARVQLEATRLQLVASGASGPATPPGAGPAMAASSAPSPASETRRRARVSQEDTADTFSMSLRRTRVRDARGDVPIFVLDLAGPLNPAASRRLGDYIEGLMTDGAAHLAINCEKLDSISPAGLEVLIQACERCRESRGDLRLCNVSEKLRKGLDGGSVANPFRIYEGERGVVMSFKYTTQP